MSHRLRKTALALLLPALLAGGGRVLSKDFELSADAMRDIEDTAHSLDSDVALKDKARALAEAREIEAFFDQLTQYYARQPDGAKPRELSLRSHALARTIIRQVEADELDAAADSVAELTQACKRCHDAHRPPR